MPVNASEVLNGEMMKHVGRAGNSSSARVAQAAREMRADARRQERLEYARRRFPNVSDREALDMLRDWEDDHR
jgi:hypothetical protein